MDSRQQKTDNRQTEDREHTKNRQCIDRQHILDRQETDSTESRQTAYRPPRECRQSDTQRTISMETGNRQTVEKQTADRW